MAYLKNLITGVTPGQPIKASQVKKIIDSLSGDEPNFDISITGNITAANLTDLATQTYVLNQTSSVYTNVSTSLSSSLHDVYEAIDNISGGGGGEDITIDGLSVYGNPNSTSGKGVSITAGTNHHVLRRKDSIGSILSFGLLNNDNLETNANIEGSKIALGTIGGDRLINNTITSSKIASQTILPVNIDAAYALVTTAEKRLIRGASGITSLSPGTTTWNLNTQYHKATLYLNQTTTLTVSNSQPGDTCSIIVTSASATKYILTINIGSLTKKYAFGRDDINYGVNALTMITFMVTSTNVYFTYTPYS